MKMTNSLDRALLILELVSSRPGGWSNAELSRRLGMATSSCSYVLGHWREQGISDGALLQADMKLESK